MNFKDQQNLIAKLVYCALIYFNHTLEIFGMTVINLYLQFLDLYNCVYLCDIEKHNYIYLGVTF